MTANDATLTFERRDEYNRRKIAERLVNALNDDADISPLMISGSWGSGKSEFVQKTISLILAKHSGITPVYVDAYKSDYHEDPLLAVSAAVLDAIPPENKDKVKQKLLPVLKATGKLGLKVLSSWVLKQDATQVADDFDKDLKKAADSASDAFIESMLNEQMRASQNIEELRLLLAEITSEKELVIFIDELDRCKPSFAVHLLELVKHIFDMKGIKFIFAANREQLMSSITHHYGNGIDAKRYLDKFISFSISLPERLKDNGSENTHIGHAHFDNTLKKYPDLSSKLGNSHSRHFLHKAVKEMCSLDNLSLREIETFIRHLNIYQKIASDTYDLDKENAIVSSVRALGVYLSCFHPHLAHAITLENYSFDSVFNVFKRVPIFKYDRLRNDALDMISMALYVHSRPEDFQPKEEEKEMYSAWVKELEGLGAKARFYMGSFDTHWTLLHSIKVMSFNDE